VVPITPLPSTITFISRLLPVFDGIAAV